MKNQPNVGKKVYYKEIEHFIVYEFEGKMLISPNKDLSKCFCVNRNKVSVKLNKKS